jgi:PAS domain S-box-containing protein
MFQVLVAEPDDQSFEQVRTYLPADSYQLSRAKESEACLNSLRRNPADVVLVSLDFPDGGAGAMLRLILNEALEVPVVVLGQPGQEAECRRIVLQGALDLAIREPQRLQLLDQTLRRVINLHRLPRQWADSELKYRTLFHHSPAGLLLLDMQGVVHDANRAAEEIFGIPRQRLFGRPLHELMPEESELRHLVGNLSALPDLTTQTVSFRRGQETLWLMIFLSEMKADLQGQYLLSLRDVTQAKRAQAELAASEAHYRDIFENLGTMILVLDVNGMILDANRWVERWTGWPRDKARTVNLFQIMREQGLGDWMEGQLRRVEDEGLIRGKQPILVAGQNLVIGYHATSVLQDGRLTGYRLAFQDLTRQVELEQEQEELQLELLEKSRLASMGRLLQGVAHNLNNPLTIIQSTLEWVRSSAPEEVNLAEELGVLFDQIQRIREIVTNMTEKGRREALRQVVRLDLNTILQEELKFLQANPFFKHEVKLESQFLPLPPILGIYSDFSQSFGNLLNNALDAMHDAPVKRLKVATACRQRDLVIEFQDTGHGIPAETLPRIFDPFFSTKPNVSVDGRPAGTGLGLHSCRMLLDPYGVKFEVESRPGAGSTFRLRLPVQPARPVRVLLVEDDTNYRLGLHAGLHAFNITVIAAASAEEALKLDEHFDAYLVDLTLPGMNGYDYVGRLKSAQPEAKVILLTGSDPVKVEARAKALKVNLVLFKPVTFRELAQAIALLDMPGSPVAKA